MRADDGSLALMELSDIDADGQFDFGLFAGVSSGLLDESDLKEAANARRPSSLICNRTISTRRPLARTDSLRAGRLC